MTAGLAIGATGLCAPARSVGRDGIRHPGGNLTGVANLSLELYPKRIEVLKAAVPNLQRLATLAGPSARPEVITKVIQDAVKAQGIEGLPVTFISRAAEIEEALAHAVELRADAIFVTPNPFFNAHREPLVALAARHRVPALCEFREFVEATSRALSPPTCPSSNPPSSS